MLLAKKISLRDPRPTASMGYVLGHAAVFLVGGLCVGLSGFGVERLALRRAELGPLRGLARVLLGLALWTGYLFALASAGALHPAGLWAGFAGSFALFALGLRRGRRERPEAPAPEPPLLRALLPAVLGLLLLPVFLGALSPSVSWDAATYHLALPKLYLSHGGFRPVELNVYSNWPLGTEILFAGAMLAQDYALAKLVHFGFGLLVLYGIRVGCRSYARGENAWLAIPLFLGNGVVLFEMQTAYVDLAHAFYFLVAFLFLFEAARREQPGGAALVLGGIAAGLVAGVKVTGCVSAAVLGACYLAWVLRARRASPGEELRALAWCYALPVALLTLPWLAKAWAFTGDPLYPFLHAWLGGPDWSVSLGEQFRSWQWSTGMGRGPMDTLLLPARVILEGRTSDGPFYGALGQFWLAAVPFAVLFGLGHAFSRRCLAAAGLGFVAWALSAQQARFLVPLLPLLSMAAAVAVWEVLGRAARGARPGVYAAAVAAALLALTAGHWNRAERAGELLSLYRKTPPDLERPRIHPALAFVNRELPEDARLLFLNNNQGFFCDRAYIADSFFEASQIADWLRPATDVASLRALLEARGITHVLAARRDWDIDYPPALAELLSDPNEATPLFRSRDGLFAVFSLAR